MQTATGSGHYAMGWEVWTDYAGRAGPVLVHAGSDTNWYAIAVLFPGSGTGVMVTANAGPDMDGEPRGIGDDLARYRSTGAVSGKADLVYGQWKDAGATPSFSKPMG